MTNSKNLGSRIDLHLHSLLSDGVLTPSEVVQRCYAADHSAIALTDHADSSNLERILKELKTFVNEQGKNFPLKVFIGIEITHVSPKDIPTLAEKARKLGAQIVIVHGETLLEPVIQGTNHAVCSTTGLINILAHPGLIAEEDIVLAKKNNIYLELTSRRLHALTNGHVVKLALKHGAKMIVNTDGHSPEDYIAQSFAFKVAKGAGLPDEEAIKTIKDYPMEIISGLRRNF
jgi:histidinol phosphatase-like PHP family hydrolase